MKMAHSLREPKFGLQTVLERYNNRNNDNPLSLVIILAGIEELSTALHYQEDGEDLKPLMVRNLQTLHETALQAGGARHTLAIGIPTSCPFQKRHPAAAEIASCSVVARSNAKVFFSLKIRAWLTMPLVPLSTWLIR